MELIILMVLVVSVALALKWLARTVPMLGYVFGTLLAIVPFVQWATFDNKYFYSDGSPAGFVLLMVYGAAGLVCFALGLAMIATAVRAQRGEEIDLVQEAKTDLYEMRRTPIGRQPLETLEDGLTRLLRTEPKRYDWVGYVFLLLLLAGFLITRFI